MESKLEGLEGNPAALENSLEVNPLDSCLDTEEEMVTPTIEQLSILDLKVCTCVCVFVCVCVFDS